MALFIGGDLGTSALKLLLVDEKGKILKTVSEEYPLSFPHPGWSEQNPADWWKAFVKGIEDLVSPEEKKQIKGIALDGQMHGLVALDEKGQVIRPAILWNDGRTIEEVDYLNKQIGKENLIKEVTDAVVRTTGAKKEAVTIIISDMKKEDYGHGGEVIK